MKVDKMLTDYLRLGDLLRGQAESLSNGNLESSAALIPLIAVYADRLHRHGGRLPDMKEEEKQELRPVLNRLLKDLESTRQQWEERRRVLKVDQARVQSARRFASEVSVPKATGPRFLSQNM